MAIGVFMPMATATQLTANYLGNLLSTGTGSTLSMGSITVGGDGLLVVAVVGRGNNNAVISSITVGGNAATLHRSGSGSSVYARGGIASREVAAGSHNITVTLSASQGTPNPALVAYVYLITNYESATPLTSNAVFSSTGATSYAMSMAIQSGAVAIYAGRIDPGSSSPNWSTAEKVDELLVTSASNTLTGVKVNSGGNLASHSETLSWTSSSSSNMLVGAVWR